MPTTAGGPLVGRWPTRARCVAGNVGTGEYEVAESIGRLPSPRGGFRRIRSRGDTDSRRPRIWIAGMRMTEAFGGSAGCRIPCKSRRMSFLTAAGKGCDDSAVQGEHSPQASPVKERIVKKRKFENLKLVS